MRLGFLLIFALCLICLNFANAQEDTTAKTNPAFFMAPQLECRGYFVIDLLQSYFYYYAPENGYSTIDSIELAMEKIRLGAEENDFGAYSLGKEKLLIEFENAKGLLVEIREKSMEGKSEKEIEKTKEEMMLIFQRRSNYLESCLAESIKKIVKQEIAKARDMISSWYATSKNMEAQGYQTREMQRTVNDASTIIDELDYRISTEHMTREMLEFARNQEWRKLTYYRIKFHALRLHAFAEKISLDYPKYSEEIEQVYKITNSAINDDDMGLDQEEYESARLRLFEAKGILDRTLAKIGENEDES